MRTSDLAALVEVSDYTGIADLLASAMDEDLTELRAWWAKGVRKAVLATARHDNSSLERDRRLGPAAVFRLLAVRLDVHPRDVAQAMVASRSSPAIIPEEKAQLLVALRGRGRQWCAEFVEELAAVPLPKDCDTHSEARIVVDLLEPLVAHFGLPLPAGPLYPDGWIARVALLASRATRTLPKDEAVPRVERVTLHDDGAAHIDRRPLAEVGLVDLIAGTPDLAGTIDLVLAAPGVVGAVRRDPATTSLPLQWRFAATMGELVDRGLLSRDRLLDRCISALQIRDDASTQRVLADLLSALHVRASDVAGRLGHVLPVMRTARGPVTAVLLPVLLAGDLPPGELANLTSIVLDRPEKAQQQLLVRVLISGDAGNRFPADELTAALGRIAAASDLRIAERARAALDAAPDHARSAALGSLGTTPVARLELWTARPAPMPTRSVPVIESTITGLAGLADLSSAESIRNWTPRKASLSLVTEARLLATLVAASYDSSEEVIAWLQSRPQFLGNDSVLDAVQHRVHGTGSTDPGSAENPWQHLRRRLEIETIPRLGVIKELLSTPSLEDGTVTLDDLIARISRAQATGYGPMDLLQALLRLEPVSPSRALDLAGLTMGVAAGAPAPSRGLLRRTPDGARITAEWILDGGLRRAPMAGDTERVLLPDAARFLPDVPDELLVPARPEVLSPWSLDAKDFLVLPRFGDLFASAVEAFLAQTKEVGRLTSSIVRLGAAGPATHSLVVRTLTHSDAATRVVGAEAVLTLIDRGLFDGARFTATMLQMLEAQELPLRRTAGALEHVMLFGGMASIWPTVLQLLDHVCASGSSVSGAADFVALVRRYTGEAPSFVPSDALRATATRSDSTKLVQEARTLVAAARSS